MPSVAARILLALRDRVLAIRGQGAMVNDLQGRVLLRRPTYDADAEKTPAVYIARRVGGGTTRTLAPDQSDVLSDTAVIFDVIAAVPLGPNTSLEAESMLADLQRALEIDTDRFLFDAGCGRNLLSEELMLVDAQFGDPQLPVAFDLVGVGVQCTWPHKYGDPDHVA